MFSKIISRKFIHSKKLNLSSFSSQYENIKLKIKLIIPNFKKYQNILDRTRGEDKDMDKKQIPHIPSSNTEIKIYKFLKNTGFPLYMYIIASNILIYLIWQFELIHVRKMRRNFVLNPHNMKMKRFHNLITYGFSHQKLMHLGANMFSLYSMAPVIEITQGPIRLLQMYMGGIILGGCLQLLNIQDPFIMVVGASGGVSSLFMYEVCENSQKIIYSNRFLKFRLWHIGLLIMTSSGYFGWQEGNKIAHLSHLGGGLFGMFVFFATRGRIRG